MINLCPFLSELSSVVELHLAKVDVEGSNPLARSISQNFIIYIYLSFFLFPSSEELGFFVQ